MSELQFILEYQKPRGQYLNSPPEWVVAGKFRASSHERAEEKARVIVGCDLPVRVTGIRFIDRV